MLGKGLFLYGKYGWAQADVCAGFGRRRLAMHIATRELLHGGKGRGVWQRYPQYIIKAELNFQFGTEFPEK